MDERTITAHLADLEAEVDVLLAGPDDDDSRVRVAELREQLEQSRDLLAQRRARLQLGEDPGLAQARTVGADEPDATPTADPR